MDKDIPAAEANRAFSRLLREVRNGQSYTVTSHGRPVARIVPVNEASADRNIAIEEMIARAAARPVANGGRWTRDELYERGRGSDI